MARDKAWAAEFRQRMAEYDQSRGINRPTTAPAVGSEDPPLPGDTYDTVRRARQEWEASAKLRQEFSCLEAYLAYRRADAKGLVRILAPGKKA